MEKIDKDMECKTTGVKNRGETTRGETSWGQNVLLRPKLLKISAMDDFS